MTRAGLDQLERDVEAARAKLAGDLTTLRAPQTLSQFTRELKAEANETVEALASRARSSAQSTIRGIVDDIKGRVAANPAAALAIGAGVAWRLIHRPPVATALIGAGIVGLLRTVPATANGNGQVDYLSHATERAKEQAGEVADQMQALAGEAVETVRGQAAELADTAQDKMRRWTEDARAATEEAGLKLKDRAVSFADQASGAVGDALDSARTGVAESAKATQHSVRMSLADPDVRSNVMLGVAGMAVAAALGIAFQRRMAAEAHADAD